MAFPIPSWLQPPSTSPWVSPKPSFLGTTLTGAPASYVPTTQILPGWGSKPKPPPPEPKPEPPAPVFGQYDPNAKNPIAFAPGAIKPGTDMGTALDQMMQVVGMLGQQDKGPAFGMVDPQKAAGLAGLAQGAGAGTGEQQKWNEDALASILSLGAPAVKKGKK